MKTKSIFILLLSTVIGFSSCSDMMDTSSDRVAYEDDNQLNNPNDSIYSVIGILAQIQKLGDRCVLWGELRGDLMTTDNNYAVTDLQKINSFSASDSNSYAGKRDFYTVINNCNYAIARMDTSITINQNKVMVPEYAQIKTLRAWTYLQLALIYGKVNYFTQPILSLDDSQKEFPSVSLGELTQKLIEDIKPYAATRELDYGSVDGWSSSQFFLPVRMLLGDLYLYNNDYENAAKTYYDLIFSHKYTVSAGYASYWNSVTREELVSSHVNAYRNDVITRMVFDSNLKSDHSQLFKLTYNSEPSLLPCQQFIDSMSLRNHFHTEGSAISRYFIGDLRGCAEYSTGKIQADAYGKVAVDEAQARYLITKFRNNLSGSEGDDFTRRPLTSLAICRPSLLYLRYAEALNRLGKHTLAFAVLKYGLNQNNISDTLKVDQSELADGTNFTDFTNSAFNGNVGTAARGCGLGIKYDKSMYIIPAGVDSTDYVEQKIVEEMAAETSFEGNRFFDLLCVSRHRTDHPNYMAEKVSAKYSNPKVMKSKLMDINAWFIK